MHKHLSMQCSLINLTIYAAASQLSITSVSKGEILCYSNFIVTVIVDLVGFFFDRDNIN